MYSLYLSLHLLFNKKTSICQSLHHLDPLDFIPLVVDTSVRLYDDFIRLLFLHAHRETSSSLVNELSEESDQFRFLRAVCLTNLKGSVGLILTKSLVIRISISSTFHLGLDLSTIYFPDLTDPQRS